MNPVFATTTLRAATVLLALSLGACSSLEGLMSGDKIDYRGQANKVQPLEVPPDLTQLAREGRYQAPTSVVSASTLRQPGAAAADPVSTVAPNAVADMRVERQGNTRWLVSGLPPEKLIPLIRTFWNERGFAMAIDNPEIGLIETEWAENRAKIPQDLIRRTIGRVLEGFYSTPERDKFRTRVERTPTGSEVYITHRGMQEIYPREGKDRTVWQPRPADPELEAEFLSRLMVKLGSKDDVARATVANAPAGAVRAKPTAVPATAAMVVPEPFDRAWRQVGLALDRTGFTIEDRDRSAGLYFVRYVDPKTAGKEEPNFFSKLFSGDKESRAQRLRVQVKADGAKTLVTMQTADGATDNGEAARAIIGKLMDEIK